MLEIVHREAPYPATGWKFACLAVPRINGAGRTYAESVAASEHCARQYLSREAGYALALEDAARLLRHTRAHRVRPSSVSVAELAPVAS